MMLRLIGLAVAAFALAAGAGDFVYMTQGDSNTAAGKNSFHLGTNWSDGEAPHGDADYLVDLGPGKYLYTNGQANPDVFAGRSLTFGNAETNAEGWLRIDLVRNVVLSNAFLVKGGFYLPQNANWRRMAGSNTVVSTASAPFAFVSDGQTQLNSDATFVGAEDAVFVLRPSNGATSLEKSFSFINGGTSLLKNYRGKIIVEGTNVFYSASHSSSSQMPATWLGDQPATLLADGVTLRNGGGLSVSSQHNFTFALGTRGVTVGAGGGTLAWGSSGRPFSGTFSGEGVLRLTSGCLFRATTIGCGGICVSTNASVLLHEDVVWDSSATLEVRNGGTLTTPSVGLAPRRTRLETGARIVCGVAFHSSGTTGRYWNDGTLMLYRNAGGDVGVLELAEGSVLDLDDGPLKLRLEDERVKASYLGRIPLLRVPTSVRVVTAADFTIERTKGNSTTGQSDSTIDRLPLIVTENGMQTVYATLPDSYVAPPNTPGVDPAEPYDTWATASTNLAEGFAYAVANVRNLNVKPGTYALKATLTASAPIQIRSDDGTGALATETTILDGGATPGDATTGIRPVVLSKSGATLQGFTVRNGYASDGGGGVLMSAPFTAVFDCFVTNCVATNTSNSARGGGINMSADGYSEIRRTTVVGCKANNGGGVFLSGSKLTSWAPRTCYHQVIDCQLIGNEATHQDVNATGGAICTANWGSCWVECCFFKGNWLTARGGGSSSNRRGAAMELSPYSVITNSVFDQHGSGTRSIIDAGQPCKVSGCVFRNLTSASGNIVGDGQIAASIVENCIFTNNSAQILYSSTHFKNCLFAYNTVHLNTGSSIFENCTVVTNARGFHVQGDGINPVFINTISAHNGSLTVTNSRGWNDFCFCWQVHTNRVTVSNCCFQSVTKWTNNMTGMVGELWSMPTMDPTGCSITGNPKLVDFTSGDFHLTRRSPCRDTGIVRDGMANDIDLDGRPRRLDRQGRSTPTAKPDMGCYECALPNPGAAILLR